MNLLKSLGELFGFKTKKCCKRTIGNNNKGYKFGNQLLNNQKLTNTILINNNTLKNKIDKNKSINKKNKAVKKLNKKKKTITKKVKRNKRKIKKLKNENNIYSINDKKMSKLIKKIK